MESQKLVKEMGKTLQICALNKVSRKFQPFDHFNSVLAVRLFKRLLKYVKQV